MRRGRAALAGVERGERDEHRTNVCDHNLPRRSDDVGEKVAPTPTPSPWHLQPDGGSRDLVGLVCVQRLDRRRRATAAVVPPERPCSARQRWGGYLNGALTGVTALSPSDVWVAGYRSN